MIFILGPRLSGEQERLAAGNLKSMYRSVSIAVHYSDQRHYMLYFITE